MQAAIERAIAYVQTHGDEVATGRLGVLLHDRAPHPDIEMHFRQAQRRDGGFAPPWALGRSGYDATCYRLASAESLGLLETDAAARALAFLRAGQHSDGSWREDLQAGVASPPWLAGEAGALYVSANCGFWLAYTMVDRAAATRAADYLAANASDDGRLPSFIQTHWLAIGLWTLVAHYNRTAQRVTRTVEARLPALSAADAAWLGITLVRAGSPAHKALLRQTTAHLLALQQPDGGWLAENSEHRTQHVAITLDVLRVLRYMDDVDDGTG